MHEFYDLSISLRVYTGGTFDMFHRGHALLFKRIKEYNNYLIVGVHTDEECTYNKRTPNDTLSQRFFMIDQCKYVDEVLVTPYQVWYDDMKKMNVDVVVCGEEGDNNMEKWIEQCYKDVEGMLITLPRTEGISTTVLRELK